ncbi:MAG: ABC transporter substrate-binding protein [Chloroflexi bacterium]|nr:ABC transporter substrate-binding protein [Chloroflexota bacterium]
MNRIWFAPLGLIVTLSLLIPGSASALVPPPEQSNPDSDSGHTVAATAQERVFTIGFSGPMTGPSAKTGEEMKNAFILAFDKIGWKIGDYQVKYVLIDDESDPEKGVRAYEAAVTRDNITCGLSGWHSSVAVAQMEVVAKYKVPHFFSTGATGLVDEKFRSDPKYQYWMVKGWPQPAKLAAVYIDVVEDAIAKGVWNPKQKNVAFNWVDSDWCRSYDQALTNLFPEKGWEIVGREWSPVGSTEFYPVYNKWKALSPEPALVFAEGDTPSINAMVKQHREANMNSLLIADNLGAIGEWYEITGPGSDYALDMMPQWRSEKAKAFVQEYTERFGTAPGPFAAGINYDTANFIIKIAQRAYDKYGEISRETLFKVGQEEVWTGMLTYKDGILMDEWAFSPETIPDPVVGPGKFIMPVVQYFDGKPTIIYPPEWKEADLSIPDWAK